MHPLPGRTSFPQGAALGVPYVTAWRALFQRAHALPGETVLVHGASGGVGIAAVQIARAAGLRVAGTAGTPEGIALACARARTMPSTTGSRPHFERRGAQRRARFDIVLEMLANVNLGRDLKILATGGRVVVIGSRGPVEIDPRDAMTRDGSILGMLQGNMSEADRSAIHAGLRAGLENGTLRPVVSREIPLSSAAESHAAVMAPGAAGKIVLVP